LKNISIALWGLECALCNKQSLSNPLILKNGVEIYFLCSDLEKSLKMIQAERECSVCFHTKEQLDSLSLAIHLISSKGSASLENDLQCISEHDRNFVFALLEEKKSCCEKEQQSEEEVNETENVPSIFEETDNNDVYFDEISIVTPSLSSLATALSQVLTNYTEEKLNQTQFTLRSVAGIDETILPVPQLYITQDIKTPIIEPIAEESSPAVDFERATDIVGVDGQTH
jgi:hypothetical protein